jgi:hypothetical protein
MLHCYQLIQFSSLNAINAFGQVHYEPEFLIGSRAIHYIHYSTLSLQKNWQVDNINIYHWDLHRPENNIYFIRTSLNKKIKSVFSFNVGLGIKNTGSFCATSLQIKKQIKNISFNINSGLCIQEAIQFEHSIRVTYQQAINSKHRIYPTLLSSIDHKASRIDRSFQYFRIGINTSTNIKGLALNANQFNSAQKRFLNLGTYIKLKLKYI